MAEAKERLRQNRSTLFNKALIVVDGWLRFVLGCDRSFGRNGARDFHEDAQPEGKQQAPRKIELKAGNVTELTEVGDLIGLECSSKCKPQQPAESGKIEAPSGLTFVIMTSCVVTFPFPLRVREYWGCSSKTSQQSTAIHYHRLRSSQRYSSSAWEICTASCPTAPSWLLT